MQVGKYGPGQPADFTGPRVTRSVDESLERLDTNYIDLILIHDVEYVDDLKEVTVQLLTRVDLCMLYTLHTWFQRGAASSIRDQLSLCMLRSLSYILSCPHAGS